jgi:peptide/nickel transport system substrate-binding protein
VSVYVWETLFTIGEAYEVIPQLAESYTQSADRLVYTIKLRSGIKFHNGDTMAAEDVKASIERFMNSPLAGGRFKALKSIEVVDPLTVRMTVTEDINLLSQLALPSRPVIMPKEIAEKCMKSEVKPEDAIGTGPYRLLEWKPDVYVRMGKFADYVPDKRFKGSEGLGGRRVPIFDEIQFVPVPEAAARIAGLETGQFDFAEAIPVTSYDSISQKSGIRPIIVKPRWGIMLELNQGEPPMDKVAFARALVYALDMEKVLQTVTGGNKQFYRLDPSIFTPEQAWFTEAGSKDIYNKKDLAKVKQLLKEANYNGEPIVYLVNKDFEWMYKACLSLEQQWKEAGINIQMEFNDWPAQIKKAQTLKGWHINQTGWSPRLDPSQLEGPLHSASVGAYNYKSATMDGLLAELRKGLELKERQKLMEQVQKLVWDDVAVIKIGDYFELEAVSTKLPDYRAFYVIPRFWNMEKK